MSTNVLTRRRITTTRTAGATAAALAANLLLFGVATVLGVSFRVSSPEPITVLTVGLFTVVPLALAALVVRIVEGRRPGFQRVAAWAGAAFAIVTVAGSITAAGDYATASTLAAMHLVVGAAWFTATYPGPRR